MFGRVGYTARQCYRTEGGVKKWEPRRKIPSLFTVFLSVSTGVLGMTFFSLSSETPRKLAKRSSSYSTSLYKKVHRCIVELHTRD